MTWCFVKLISFTYLHLYSKWLDVRIYQHLSKKHFVWWISISFGVYNELKFELRKSWCNKYGFRVFVQERSVKFLSNVKMSTSRCSLRGPDWRWQRLHTHTQITSQQCELIMSMSPVHLTAMQKNAGNRRSWNQGGKRLYGVKLCWLVGATGPDSDSRQETVVCWRWYDKSTLLLIFLVSAALSDRKERERVGTPPPGPSGASRRPLTLG